MSDRDPTGSSSGDAPPWGRSETAKVLVDLLTPALGYLTPDGAALDLPRSSVADFDDEAARLEGLSRVWLGAAMLRAGGFTVPAWDRLVAGLDAGPARWGAPRSLDQRLVAAGTLAPAALLLPELHAAPGAPATPLRGWLERTLTAPCGDNNRVLFRVTTRLAIEALGGAEPSAADSAAMLADLRTVDAMAAADGAWSDGAGGPWDYYGAWMLHPLTLLYAHRCAARDPLRAARWRAAARAFAPTFRALWDDAGLPVPYGRSLSYRFGATFFWGALACWDDAPPLPWGALRALALRPIAAFLARPIRDGQGLLLPGWTHAQPRLAEAYTGPWSPYWALTAFLPLTLPADHPFWTAPAEDAAAPAATTPLRAARAVVMRSPTPMGGVPDVVLLASGHAAPRWLAGSGARYAKLATSSRFGLGLDEGPDALAPDSALLVFDLLGRPRTRVRSERAWLDGDVVVSDWRPLAGVSVRTWLVPCPPWHVRVHRVTSALPLATVEGGFLVGLPDDGDPNAARAACPRGAAGPASAAVTGLGASLIVDLPVGGGGARVGSVRVAPAGASLCAPRALVPVLTGRLRVLRDWLASAVVALPRDLTAADPAVELAAVLATRPAIVREGGTLVVTHGGRSRAVAL